MKIDNIKSKYTKKLNSRIKKYFDIILASFIEFYGKKYEQTIINRFNDIAFLYYINDSTIFYIFETLKNENYNKIKSIDFIIPYIIYLVENNFYKQKVSYQNFYELGKNKIIGVSDYSLLSNLQLVRYFIAIALRNENQNPYEVNLPFDQDIKRIVALPLFSVTDKDLFHEINHAICSESIVKGDETLVKCGLDYSDKEPSFAYEIINDLLSIDIYNIFLAKCKDKILEDNIMSEVFVDAYLDYHNLIAEFYEENKERIKLSVLKHSEFKIKKEELESLSKILKR